MNVCVLSLFLGRGGEGREGENFYECLCAVIVLREGRGGKERTFMNVCVLSLFLGRGGEERRELL